MLARKGYFTMGGMLSLVKFSIGLSVLVGASYCIRSYGRSHNQKYRIFLNSLEKLKGQSNIETRKEIKNYDFEFSWWPIDYEFNEDTVKANRYKQIAKHSWSKLVQSPCSIISYVVLHTFGIRLIYPGSIRALSFMMGSALNQGRSKLIETDNGERFKLKTSDGNYLDTMFIDKRLNSSIGKTLVICTEGNAGFYEYGIMVTPLEAGYSVLGWNHPGFAGSTGMPYPDQEQNGIDTVMQFAINKLGFLPDNIILFGWSIGGYATTWAAMNYPEVKAVILDATFDDLLPLAIPRMPAVLEPIVKLTIRQYANLDVARQLVHYPGPILLVRRANDEIICLEPNDLSTNRGNNLLVKLLRQRFPNLMVCMDAENALLRYLGASGRQQSTYTIVNILIKPNFESNIFEILFV
ncbi:hypothetical protein AAG570_012075 [Ranatra chinensis]|uniref:AB hydrolase-1 domain-containing protein n=1 Tax=Ranatra chinensis TaxID=642074 RepID=A0ABD0YJU5_9HEMI